jgi:hypothetical protein
LYDRAGHRSIVEKSICRDANWKRWSAVLERDFIEMMDVDALSIDARISRGG